MQQLSGRESTSLVPHWEYWCAEKCHQTGHHWCHKSISEPQVAEGETEVLRRRGWRIKTWSENEAGRDHLLDGPENPRAETWLLTFGQRVGDSNIPGIEAAHDTDLQQNHINCQSRWWQVQSWERKPAVPAATSAYQSRRRYWWWRFKEEDLELTACW